MTRGTRSDPKSGTAVRRLQEHIILGLPKKVKNDHRPFSEDRTEKGARRTAGHVTGDSAPVTPALSPASRVSHPYNNNTPCGEESQDGFFMRMPFFKARFGEWEKVERPVPGNTSEDSAPFTSDLKSPTPDVATGNEEYNMEETKSQVRPVRPPRGALRRAPACTALRRGEQDAGGVMASLPPVSAPRHVHCRGFRQFSAKNSGFFVKMWYCMRTSNPVV